MGKIHSTRRNEDTHSIIVAGENFVSVPEHALFQGSPSKGSDCSVLRPIFSSVPQQQVNFKFWESVDCAKAVSDRLLEVSSC